jgi:uncharacterized membrane protein
MNHSHRSGPWRRVSRFFGRFIPQHFLRGLTVLVPTAITLALLFWFFDKMDGILRPFVRTPGVGLLLLLFIILLVGWISTFGTVKRFFRHFDVWLEHTPGVSFVYSSTRDFLEAFAGRKRRFTHAVLVNVLADEVWLVGFLTDEDLDGFKLGAQYVSVYVPQAYNVAGQLYLVKRERVRPIEHLSAADVMKYAVTGGAVELTSARNGSHAHRPAPKEKEKEKDEPLVAA